jgi:transcriptional regulator with XRE-family HTH domain
MGARSMALRLKNTVRERRTARNWSMQTLAEKVGTTVGTINRIETGETKLLHDLVPALGTALGCQWRDLFVDEDSGGETAAALPGFHDEAAPYIPGAADPLHSLALGPNRDLWAAKSDALNAIGIAAGQPIVVNISQDAVDRAASLDAVIIQVIDPHNPMQAVTLLRQFIEPDLFITNSTHTNAAPLTKRDADIRIKGIVENVISAPRPSRS